MSDFASQIDTATVFVAVLVSFGGLFLLYLYKNQLKTKQNESASKCFDENKPYNILQRFLFIVIGHLLFRLPSLMGYYNDTDSCRVCIQMSLVFCEVAKMLCCMEIMPIITKYTDTQSIAHKFTVTTVPSICYFILIIDMLSGLHLRGTVNNSICLYQISNLSYVTITCSWAVIGILNAFVVNEMYSNLGHSEKEKFKPWMICCVIFIFFTSIALCFGYHHLKNESFLILVWFAQFSCLYYQFYGFHVKHYEDENYENVESDNEDIMAYRYDHIDSDDMDMGIIHSRMTHQRQALPNMFRAPTRIKRSVRSISNPSICIDVMEEQNIEAPTASEMLQFVKRLRISQMPSTDATISNSEESTESTDHGNMYMHYDESDNYNFSHIDTSDDSYLLGIHGDNGNGSNVEDVYDSRIESFNVTETTIDIGLEGTKHSDINAQIGL